MKTFNKVLINNLVAGVTGNFLWFALTFWAYLETRSVLATSIIGGSYMVLSTLVGIYFGTLVDKHHKKAVMVASSAISLGMFLLAWGWYELIPQAELLNLGGWQFWLFVILILGGAIAGNLRMIALSTTVTLLVPEKGRDKANGLVGTVNGVSFAVTSVFSGLAIGQLGMGWALGLTVALTLAAGLHMLTVAIPEKRLAHAEHMAKVDIKGALAAVKVVPGLLGLIFFATFNNFLGGVFMSLMDPYGLNLVSVETWGFIWGFISIAFILGGLAVAKKGLGASPLKTLFLANIAMWILCILFPLRSSVVILVIAMFIYMTLIPVVEAAEQTVIQKVVPLSKQGRVFGFAQSVETAAAPITAFLIGPLAQLVVIPFMTDGKGVDLIGNWFGTGPERGMALIFIVAGVIGLIVTLWAMTTKAYRALSDHYANGDGIELPPATLTPKG